ncbi:MAG: M43 family zinc metalloprotease, partial [Dolichospermum sp.]
MKKLIIFCSGIFLSTLSFSQDRLGAFCPEPINEEMQNSIGIQTQNLDANSSIKKVSATIIKVPIVFHILTDDPTGVSNISDCIIKNQVDILNNCFRKKLGTQGYNTNPVGADTEIEFFLPCKDGNGNSTTGIIRTTTPNCNYTTLNNTTQLSNIKSASSGANNFPNNKFLNIWVVKTMPNSNNVRAQAWWGNTSTGANRVGVIIHYSYLGSKNSGCQNLTYLDITGFQAYDMGATLVHEVGHYFSLQHTYGTCGSYTDGCADTPEVSGLPNALCGTNNNTKGVCTAGQTRMWQNYLDYTDDACMNIFTNDQKTKMRNYINATTNYINLTSATNIDAVSCASS